jgi:hypothetical protein
MRKIEKASRIIFLVAALVSVLLGTAYADTTIITTTRDPYFHTGSNPVAGIFYFLGDVVVLPFRLVGDLFA